MLSRPGTMGAGTRLRAVGTEDAAHTRLWPEYRTATLTLVEKDALVGRHLFRRLMSALRTGDRTDQCVIRHTDSREHSHESGDTLVGDRKTSNTRFELEIAAIFRNEEFSSRRGTRTVISRWRGRQWSDRCSSDWGECRAALLSSFQRAPA